MQFNFFIHIKLQKAIRNLLLVVFALYFSKAIAQQTLSLHDAIQLAQQNSINAQLNNNNYEIANQTYSLQRAQLFPQINLNANLPGYTNSITSVTQPDGTIRFTTVEQAFSNVGVSLSQKIAATGGTFTASSNINRFDRLSGDRTTNYNTQPFVLGYNQPLFRFNETAFTQKAAKLSKLIGEKTFVAQQEQIAFEVSNQFHALLQSQEQLALLKATQAHTDTLLQTAKSKLHLGKIGEEEYLQIQLEYINTITQLQQAQANYSILLRTFCNLLNVSANELTLKETNAPFNQQKITIDGDLLNQLLAAYKKYNPQYEQQKLAQLQNEAALQRAKLNRMPGFTLIAGYGSNQSAPVLNDAYQNLLTQQNATLGVAVPLFSSGANAANYKIADYQLKNQQLQLQQLEQRITLDILTQLQAYNFAMQQMSNAQLADSIAQRRYEISYNIYQAGKLTYTDLLLAQNQQLQARQGYVAAMAAYWQAYYQIRAVCFWDVVRRANIIE
jgi:outer membrane protein TolC